MNTLNTRTLAAPAAVAHEARPEELAVSNGVLLLGAGLAVLLVFGVALLLGRRQRRQRRVAQDTALLEHSVPSIPPAALASVGTPAPSPVAAAVAAGPPVSTRMAAVVAGDRAARSQPPPSGISMPPNSERQWLSQRPPRGDRDPER